MHVGLRSGGALRVYRMGIIISKIIKTEIWNK